MTKKRTEPASPPVHCSFQQMVPISELRRHPRNPNTHPRRQVELLANAILRTGWRGVVTISNQSGFIVTGHGRLDAAEFAGLAAVPCDFQDFASEAEELEQLLFDNRIAALAEMDHARLVEGIEYLRALGREPAAVGWSEEEMTALAEGLKGLGSNAETDDKSDRKPSVSLAERFGVPPFSVLDARQGYWQDRKRAWLALGIQSELGRGGENQRSLSRDGLGGEDNPGTPANERGSGTLGAIPPNERTILKRTGKYETRT